MWPGDVYPPSVTMGAPLRAPKQQYIPLQHHAFASHVLLFRCGYSLQPSHHQSAQFSFIHEDKEKSFKMVYLVCMSYLLS